MGVGKRKRQSMDSAIADMSSEDSFLTKLDTQRSDYNTPITQYDGSADSHPSKRRKSSCIILESGFNVRDYGTAASQRPRRGTACWTACPNAVPPAATGRKKRHKEGTISQDNGVKTSKQSRRLNGKAKSRAHEVKENHVELEQTPSVKQRPVELPTPQQTIERTTRQTSSQSSLRRSARDRRPTAGSHQGSVGQDTPCRKPTKTSTILLGSSQGEDTPAKKDRESYIVRLRLPLVSENNNTEQSMSFTGSFSHRQKVNEDSQNTQEQSQSFVENVSFRDCGPETFAQPQEQPIPLDSQELYSSQSRADDEATSVSPGAHLQEHVQTNGSPACERFNTSEWFSQQNKDRLLADVTPEVSAHPRDHAYLHSPTEQKDVAIDNDSWHTQPTLPWCKPWNAQSPKGMQHAPEPANVSFHASQATTIDEESLHLPRFQQSSQDTDELHAIANRLLAHRTFDPPKPEPVGQPAVWADGRMDLCETLHYFRSYQGACHSTGGFVRGFMFDKVAHPRDYIDSNVVIARAGGGQVKDKDSGEMKASGDQAEGTVSQNLRNCMSHYNPVVIITGVDNPHIPSQPPHQYCVMDYFKPTHIWFEKSGDSRKIVRYRFEKLNARKDSWWRPKSLEDPLELGCLPPPVVKTCDACSQESLQIYLNSWMCLQPTCTSFWLIPLTEGLQGLQLYEPDEASLIYDPRFLKCHTPWPNDTHSYPLTSNDALLSAHAVPGENTSEAFTRGVVCPSCGRCNSRISWLGWSCPCGWKKEPPHTLAPALSIREPLWPLSYGYTQSRDTHSALVKVHVDFAHGYRINRYTLPGINGFITHMIANRTVVSESGGPDDMFEELQREDIGLRRRSLQNTQLKGGMWTRHFAVNYGMPYKFIAATDSHPFSSAARPITATRSRLNWAAKYLHSQSPSRSLNSSFDAMSTSTASNSSISSASAQLRDFEAHEFNEVLALGYFESQKINYHDDGEFGLGPTIATLSLGAPGTMRIRLKAKHHLGVSTSGVYTDALPLPGCNKYEERTARVNELRDLKATCTPSQYKARLKQLPKELGIRASGNAKDALTMKLGHGDIVVMHGAELQAYYEHAVEHSGKLRFALTCRYIDPESLPEKERPTDEVEADTDGYDGSRLEAEGEGGDPMEHTLT